MKKLIIVWCFLPLAVCAQEEKRVMEPINLLFEGMKRGDSAMVRRAFHPAAELNSILVDAKTNQPLLRNESLAGFLKSVGTPHKDVYNELTWGEKVQIDGNFAQVWVDYAFYLGPVFNHCGVDAFHLFRNAQGNWVIFSLSDTRRKTGCDVPKEVSDRAK